MSQYLIVNLSERKSKLPSKSNGKKKKQQPKNVFNLLDGNFPLKVARLNVGLWGLPLSSFDLVYKIPQGIKMHSERCQTIYHFI